MSSSDTPRTDARLGYGNEHHGANMLCRELERELNSAMNCINAIEAHYKAKHGESYDHTTLHTIIENWRNK